MKYGFWFWLSWILWFAGSFVAATVFWTVLLNICFGPIVGGTLTTVWAISVFGSWFLLIIPFMRKKERLWKRLSPDQEDTVDLWFKGLCVLVAFIVANSFFWTFQLRGRISLTLGSGMSPLWVKAVLSSTLIFLIPFLVLMYRKADRLIKAFGANGLETRSLYQKAAIARSQRVISPELASKLDKKSCILPGAHIVTAYLCDGRKVPHVFVANQNEIMGIYDQKELGFSGTDVVDLEVMNQNDLPAYEESKWLRFDDRNNL